MDHLNAALKTVALLAVLAMVIIAVRLNTSDARDAAVKATQGELVKMQRAGCERGKLDRADNAAGWTAHRRYIRRVTKAASVKEDVKRAARKATRTYDRIAVALRRRARIDCARAFPIP